MEAGVNHHGFYENHHHHQSNPNVFTTGTFPFSPLTPYSGSFPGQFDPVMGDCSASSSSSLQSFMTTAPLEGGTNQNMVNSAGRNMGFGLFNQPSEERMLNNVPYDVGLCENFLKMHVGDEHRDYCNTSKIRVDPHGFLAGFIDPLSNGVGPVAGLGFNNHHPVHDPSSMGYNNRWGQGWGVGDLMGPSSSPFLPRRQPTALFSENQRDCFIRPVKELERGCWTQGFQQQKPLMVNNSPFVGSEFLNYMNNQQCRILENAAVSSPQLTNPLLELDLAYRLQMQNQNGRATPNPAVNVGGQALPMMANTGLVEGLNGEGSFILDSSGHCSKCLAKMKSKGSKVQKKGSRIRNVMTRSSGDDLVFDDEDIRSQAACESGSRFGQSKLREMSTGCSSLGIPIPIPMQLGCESMLDLKGYIYSLCKHQVGCRFLQLIFDEGSHQDIELVFNEVIEHVVELMVDPFGNYLIQKLLEVCSEEQRILVALMVTKQQGDLIKICLDSHGTRVVQKLIETIKSKQHISMIILALKPGLLELMNDLNGNHVVQRCLQCLGNDHNKHIYDTAAKFSVDIATHQHGCCVLNRCIAYSSGKYREKLVSSVCANGLLLAQDAFGNYVIQYIIELKIPAAAATLLSQFQGHFAYLSMQKFSSHVVEKCLRFIEDSHPKIIQDLISVPQFDQLLQDRFANYVIQSALEITKGSLRALLVEAIRPHEGLRTSPYCKKIFSRNLLKK
ncbi:OLC1v1017428C1 [Oldenlandia corymbosa var. corymbosa]|uniref:OLC1v1017428C1 n=1 Tax=Oldenlandia corymbosa var. corymbosa TaxID=529605 RepID=A0AAV1E9E8_OLDCO|nr:OLC1v1017428C1 [Oldenlandia corymbosa var. corymbosa]